MTEPFDWAVLFDKALEAYEQCASQSYGDAEKAAAAYLRERIEAAFVPVERYKEAEAQREGCIIMAEGFKAHAEAAEARVKALEEALHKIAVGDGIGGPDAELQCADIARAALGGEHDK